jgi:hypothetical protein
MVRLLPSGPDPIPMIGARGAALQLRHETAAGPEGQSLIVDGWACTVSVTTSPAVTPACRRLRCIRTRRTSRSSLAALIMLVLYLYLSRATRDWTQRIRLLAEADNRTRTSIVPRSPHHVLTNIRTAEKLNSDWFAWIAESDAWYDGQSAEARLAQDQGP